MSECVVRMEMPENCQYCAMAHWDLRNILSGCDAVPGKRYLQGKDDEFWKDGRPSWCPIICSLPEGHGRLVDISPLDVIAFRDKDCSFYAGALSVCERIDKLPTIVQADTAERSET